MSHLRVPFRVDAGAPVRLEELEVEPVEDGFFRLLHSPAMVEGLAKGDVFALDSESPLGFRVRERGGLFVIWLFFATTARTASRVGELSVLARSLGGVLEGSDRTVSILSFPVAAGLEQLSRAFDRVVQTEPGASWMFGNVYDPSDGRTPLNWWT